ncbi:CDPK-related kinase 1 [Raphanus sativus]|uniref:non-specific serine/threonine protein kinase n=1 Tax=Raphanus sativus TaxID=3726 RepID=A0A6J0NFN8_RAPSA|nr:CDPK-related kinase 1-like [Raphanus sativus]KAJ4904026.1 CDPK-related kinase 1 [Raphanus sativus]
MGICHGKPIEHRSKQSRSQVSAETDEANEVGGLDKSFGFSKQFSTHYEIDGEVGRGHLGYTCSAKGIKGTSKGHEVAVKVIHKAKLTNALMVEDVSREVKIMRALTGHKNLVQFYDAFEDDENVYIVMELCKGGNLLDKILERGCKYPEDDAKHVMVQILDVVAYCHLQGVVRRDLKPQHFLFSTKDETSPLKAVGFGFSGYVRPDERLNDIVGSSFHVAPEVLHRTYGTESDMWMVGVLAYVLLSGSRPFWAPTEYELFRAVLKTEPSFEEAPWPSLSPDAVDFVKRLLHKDYRKRLTAAQALCHPWLVGSHEVKIPCDMIIYKLVRVYIMSTSLRKSALAALAKTLTVPQLAYLREQFTLLEPSTDGYISMQNFKTANLKSSTDGMKDSGVFDYVHMISCLQYKKLEFE